MLKQFIKIYFAYDNEYFEWEAINRGWRNDVYVVCDNCTYHVNVYTPTRLLQDYETEMEGNGFYSIDENIILVSEADKESIISVILRLYCDKYFNKIKSVLGIDFNNMIQVY